jgi:AcrR family transcriptional regulator
MFLERGYDPVRLEDICAECDVSLRTFFRYFSSKEDLVLGRLRAHLDVAEALFAERPDREPLLPALHAVVERVVRDYAAEPGRELTRLRLAAETPALQARLADVFTGFERLVRRVADKRISGRGRDRRARLAAAAAVAAFRVALEMWVEDDAAPDLAELVTGNLDILVVGALTT